MVRQFAEFLAEVWSKLFTNALTTVVVPTDWPLAIAFPGLLSLTKQHVICWWSHASSCATSTPSLLSFRRPQKRKEETGRGSSRAQGTPVKGGKRTDHPRSHGGQDSTPLPVARPTHYPCPSPQTQPPLVLIHKWSNSRNFFKTPIQFPFPKTLEHFVAMSCYPPFVDLFKTVEFVIALRYALAHFVSEALDLTGKRCLS